MNHDNVIIILQLYKQIHIKYQLRKVHHCILGSIWSKTLGNISLYHRIHQQRLFDSKTSVRKI